MVWSADLLTMWTTQIPDYSWFSGIPPICLVGRSGFLHSPVRLDPREVLARVDLGPRRRAEGVDVDSP